MSRTLTVFQGAWASVRQAVQAGRRTDALRLLRRYLHLSGLSVQQRARAEALTGQLYLSLGEYSRARCHLRRAVMLCPTKSRWQYHLGRAWAEDPLGGYDRAAPWFRRAWRQVPQQPLYRSAYGEALIGMGKARRGVRLLLQAARQAAGNWSVLQRVVRGMIQAGRPLLALRVVRPARFLCHTPAAVRQLEEWMRQLRFEHARRSQPLPRSVIYASSRFPLRAG
jgi:predicted Zn-dependent protease